MRDSPLRIYAWNVNGIRALLRKTADRNSSCFGHLENFVRTEDPDVVVFTETKSSRKSAEQAERDLLAAFERALPGSSWTCYWSHCGTRPGRHGTAALARASLPVTKVTHSLDPWGVLPEPEGRVVGLKIGDDLWVAGLYVPNASRNLVRLRRKLDWLVGLRGALDAMVTDAKTVVAIGDFNVAPEPCDICHPSSNKRTAGFTTEERERFAWLLGAADSPGEPSRAGPGYVDTWRAEHPLPPASQGRLGAYTFWTSRGNARATNAGWRLDLALVNRGAAHRVVESKICSYVRGSDHCPVGLAVARDEERTANDHGKSACFEPCFKSTRGAP